MNTERGGDVEPTTAEHDARDSDPQGTRPTVRLRAVPALPTEHETPTPESVGRYSHVYGRSPQSKPGE